MAQYSKPGLRPGQTPSPASQGTPCTMTRDEMLEAYEANNEAHRTELSYGMICQAIHDGMIDYNPVADMLTVTAQGRAEAKKRGRKIAEIH